MFFCFLSSRRRHTICALVTGVQTCALPIYPAADQASIPPFNTKVGRVVFASKRSRADAVRIPERHMKLTSDEGSIVSRLVSPCESGWECAPAIGLRPNASDSRISEKRVEIGRASWRESVCQSG